MGDATRILQQIEAGDGAASGELFPIVYDELRRLAARRLMRENPGQTLQATALVHEAFVRLVDVERAQHWESRGHFFAAAAEAMRRILVENARRKKRLKRGGAHQRVQLHDVAVTTTSVDPDILALDEVLTALETVDSQAAQVVKLHYFAGLTMEQAAQALGVSVRTAYRDWAFARAWLFERLSEPEESR